MFALKVTREINGPDKQLTYLTMPENNPDKSDLQLGLLDISPASNINRVSDYINRLDATVVDRKSARTGNIIKTSDKSENETFVLVTANYLLLNNMFTNSTLM